MDNLLPVPISLVQRLTFLLVEHLATEASQLVGQQHLFEQCVPAQYMLQKLRHILLVIKVQEMETKSQCNN